MAQRVCPICGAPIPSDAHPNQRLCSDACRREQHRRYVFNQRREQHPAATTCSVCGKPLEPGRNGNARLCGDCAASANKRYARAHLDRVRALRAPRVCPYCGSQFAPTQRRHKYCSEACAAAANRTNRREAARKRADAEGRSRRARARTPLAQRRIAAGLTQADLARLAQISTSQICMYESCKSTPSLQTALRIACALGCTIEDIFEIDKED